MSEKGIVLLSLFFNLHISKRLIGDCSIMFNHDDCLQDFCLWINQIDPNIKFTWQSNKNAISFLDTQLYRTNENILAEQLYKKDTDHFTYLQYDSFHPL